MTKQELTILEDQIRAANNAYWNENNPTISDIEYDNLVRKLQKAKPDSELLQHIGGTKGKYRHTKPMLSLDKAYTFEELKAWMDKTVSEFDYISAQPKYDGIAGKIEGGRLVTRGDGLLGEDITRHIDCIRVLVFSHDVYHKCSLREFFGLSIKDQPVVGELMVDKDTFEKVFKTGKIRRADGSLYSNPRNAVAGVLNQKEPMRFNGLITFVPYNISAMITTRNRFDESWFERVKTELDSDFKIYPRDGIVLKVTKPEQYEALGNTAHHPRGAIAFKFSNPTGSGIADRVIWQNGKGRLTPVIVFKEPVDINDVLVTRVTAHNLEQFLKFDIAEGDIVHISRAGDVIPKIESVEHIGSVKLPVLTECTVCGSPTKVDGKYLCCSNEACPGGYVSRLEQAAKCLRIDGFGEATCTLLHEQLNIKYLWELLRTNYCKSISYLPGFTDYSANLLYQNVLAAVGSVMDYEVIASLCIHGIGLEIAKKLMQKYTDEEVFLDDNWNDMEVLGPIRGSWLLMAKEKMRENIVNAFEYFKPMRSVTVETKGKICFSGKFDQPKSAYENMVESAGYEFTNKLTQDVVYLVANEDHVSNKVSYAKHHNIPVITLDKLKEMLNI